MEKKEKEEKVDTQKNAMAFPFSHTIHKLERRNLINFANPFSWSCMKLSIDAMPHVKLVRADVLSALTISKL